jgi:hypothetical protein
MSRQDIADLEYELGRWLDEFREGRGMTTAEVVGVLDVIKIQLVMNAVEAVVEPD